jgi:hypothetical protein
MSTSTPTSAPDDAYKDKALEFEKTKYRWDFVKWFFVSVVLALIAAYTDNAIKDRSTGIQEMQAFDKYVDVILKADNVEERWRLTEFFSTVTPTDRLRKRWVTYRDLIKPEYDKYKKLKDSAAAILKQPKSPESINRYNAIKKELEPYEKKLANPITLTENPSSVSIYPAARHEDYNSPQANAQDLNQSLRSFKDQLRRDSASDFRYKLDGLFQKAHEIHNSVVRGLISDLGDPYQDIQTGYNRDYTTATFSNQYGIVRKFDNTKEIWPIFQARFLPADALFTLKDKDSTETLRFPANGIDWDSVKNFDRGFFIKRLDQLK